MKSRSLPAMNSAAPCSGCSRRAVLQGLGLAAVGAVLLDACAQQGSSVPTATVSTCGTGHCIDLTDAANAALATAGGALLFDTSSDTVMVIRVSATEVAALSAICTHEGCSMDYAASRQQLDCPCHGSQFSLDGMVTRAPATRPLKKYANTFDDQTQILTITLA